jgi:hypothetical protein
MIIRNEDIKSVSMEVPEGHRHLRTIIVLNDGTELALQEATVANLVRAYITITTHPSIDRVQLSGRKLSQRKEGYAEWQLLENNE